jgi:hypothetical protein
MESDTTSEAGSEASHDLESVIDHVENCIRMLDVAEGCTYLQFHAPKAEEAERTVLWTKHGIKEQYPVEQLEGLLHALAFEERRDPWFKWLTWVLFGSA